MYLRRFGTPGLFAIAALTALAVSTGCDVDPTLGYTGQSPYRQGIRTIAVPIWTRAEDVYRRELEYDLTRALVARIEAETDYKVTTRKTADTLLTGTIEEIEQQVLSYNPDTGDAREVLITMTVTYTWEDLRTGEVLVKREHFPVAANYMPTAPYSEIFFQGSQNLMEKLAVRIVETMQAEWGQEDKDGF